MLNCEDDICKMINTMAQWVEEEMSTGVETVDVDELGKAVDILKDFAQTKAYLAKACYYETVVTAMENGSHDASPTVELYSHHLDQDDGSHSMQEILSNMRHMYKEANPELKKKMKSDVNALMAEMA